MRWNIPQPVEAGGFEGGVGVEATGDGAADEGGALFFQQGQHLFLFRHQCIDARGFAVEVVGDQALGFAIGARHVMLAQKIRRKRPANTNTPPYSAGFGIFNISGVRLCGSRASISSG